MLVYYSIKQWFINLRSGKFIVKNSPLDPIGTCFRAAFASLRNATTITFGTGMTFALAYELDDILESEGKERFFCSCNENSDRKSRFIGPCN
jgi:hypothetical protein